MAGSRSPRWHRCWWKSGIGRHVTHLDFLVLYHVNMRGLPDVISSLNYDNKKNTLLLFQHRAQKQMTSSQQIALQHANCCRYLWGMAGERDNGGSDITWTLCIFSYNLQSKNKCMLRSQYCSTPVIHLCNRTMIGNFRSISTFLLLMQILCIL